MAECKWSAEDRQQAVTTLWSLQELSAAQIDWIAEDVGNAVIEATLPKRMREVAQTTEPEMELQAAIRHHLITLPQDWAERVAAEVKQVTEL